MNRSFTRLSYLFAPEIMDSNKYSQTFIGLLQVPIY